MPKRDDALADAALAASIENAVDATSNEIFASAFGDDDPVLDETGDRSIEDMGEGLEGQTEDEDDAESGEDEGLEESEGEDGKHDKKGEDGKEGEEAKGDDAAEKAAADKLAAEKPEGRVPAGRLREQTDKTKAAETERDTLKAQVETERANARKEIDGLNAKLDGVLAALQRQQQPAPKAVDAKAETPPDVFEDPKGFAEYLTKGFQSELAQRDQAMASLRVDLSMQTAAGRHGEGFAKAYDAVTRLDPNNPDDQVTVRRIWASPNPGEALVTWHRNQETLREVGSDPAKFKERIATETRDSLMKDPEFRKALIAELRAEAGDDGNGKPTNSVVRLPRSLNGANGGTSRERVDPSTVDDSQQGIFESAWRD